MRRLALLICILALMAASQVGAQEAEIEIEGIDDLQMRVHTAQVRDGAVASLMNLVMPGTGSLAIGDTTGGTILAVGWWLSTIVGAGALYLAESQGFYSSSYTGLMTLGGAAIGAAVGLQIGGIYVVFEYVRSEKYLASIGAEVSRVD